MKLRIFFIAVFVFSILSYAFSLSISGFVRDIVRKKKDSMDNLLSGRFNISESYKNVYIDIEYALEYSYLENKEFLKPFRNNLLDFYFQNIDNKQCYKGFLHHGYIEYQSERFILSIGRKVITWGEGRFLNPLNLTSSYSPFLIDFDDINGIDVLGLNFFIGDTQEIVFILNPYLESDSKDLDDLNIKNTNILGKYKITIETVDLSILGGKHFWADVLGFEFSWSFEGMLIYGSYILRNEPAFVDYNVSSKVYNQGIVGIEYNLFDKIVFEFEVFLSDFRINDFYRYMLYYEELIRLGKALPLKDDVSFFATNGRIISEEDLYLQVSLSYEYFPFDFSIFLIYPPFENKVVVFPNIKYEISERITLNAMYLYSYRFSFVGSMFVVYGKVYM